MAYDLHQALAWHDFTTKREVDPRLGVKIRVFYGDYDLGLWDAAFGWEVVRVLETPPDEAR